MSIRVGINGFGRIGRAVLRAIVEYDLNDTFEVVCINSNGGPAEDIVSSLAHLLTYDSVHGRFQAEVVADESAAALVVNGRSIHVDANLSPESCHWGQHDVDVVFECTGKYTDKAGAMQHIKAGAKKVLISAPSKDADAMVVFGVNHEVIRPEHQIISNASCTTNCLAPLVAPLHADFGIDSGIMTTIHAYTNDQRLLDTRHQDLRRARAAGQSMIPTRTGAATAIGQIIPELEGRLVGGAMRIPLANVSLVDVTLSMRKPVSVEAINACLQSASESTLSGVLAVNDLPLVSIDFNHHSASAIADLTQTTVVDHHVKVMAWYDNEWGFACRMLDTAQQMMACA
jgi:glyceraldehyde 3-phosphate dehydrogenase